MKTRNNITRIILYLTIVFCLVERHLAAQTPVFRIGGAILVEGSNQFLFEYSQPAPCVTDWNDDGKKDLLIGSMANGDVVLFLNLGTDADPLFELGTHLFNVGDAAKPS